MRKKIVGFRYRSTQPTGVTHLCWFICQMSTEIRFRFYIVACIVFCYHLGVCRGHRNGGIEMLKYIKRGLIVCMLALVFVVLAYLLGVKTYDTPKKEKTQVYETDWTILRSTKTQRLSQFKSTLEKVEQSGGGEVIFEGGKGFVLFRVRKDGTLVAMVPVFASILHISSRTLFRLILLSKRYYTIRLTSWDKEQLEQIAPFHNVSEREVPISENRPTYIP